MPSIIDGPCSFYKILTWRTFFSISQGNYSVRQINLSMLLWLPLVLLFSSSSRTVVSVLWVFPLKLLFSVLQSAVSAGCVWMHTGGVCVFMWVSVWVCVCVCWQHLLKQRVRPKFIKSQTYFSDITELNYHNGTILLGPILMFNS